MWSDIPNGEWLCCSLLALIAHLSPQNLLTCHLIYQLKPVPHLFVLKPCTGPVKPIGRPNESYYRQTSPNTPPKPGGTKTLHALLPPRFFTVLFSSAETSSITYPCVPSGNNGSCTTTRRLLLLRRRTAGALRMITNHSTEPASQSSC